MRSEIAQSPADAAVHARSATTFGPIVLSQYAVSAVGSSAGGDWCESFALSPTVIAVSIGDVCGHDEAASRFMVEVRREIRTEASAARDPARILYAVNERSCRRDSSTYATAILAIIDLPTQTLSFASAGHPAPFLVEHVGSRFLRYEHGDMPLGIQPALQIASHRLVLAADALLVFYTDGVVELDRDAAAGEHRLREAARHAHRAPAIAAADAIAQYLQLRGRKQDDASLLTVRTAREA